MLTRVLRALECARRVLVPVSALALLGLVIATLGLPLNQRPDQAAVPGSGPTPVATVTLTVVSNGGRTSAGPGLGECTRLCRYPVEPGRTVVLDPTGEHIGFGGDRPGTCLADNSTSCDFTVTTGTTVEVRFAAVP
jgi:hypothetical protein